MQTSAVKAAIRANELGKLYHSATLTANPANPAAGSPIPVESFQMAEVPADPSRPNRPLCIILVILGALLTPLGTILMVNASRRSRRQSRSESLA